MKATLHTGHRCQGFDRSRLPDPPTYFATELEALRVHGRNATARCPFQVDQHPRLSVNLETGAFLCRGPSYDANGRGDDE